MIRFEGKITSETFKWFLKRETIAGIIVMYPICIFGCALVVYLSIINEIFPLLSVLILIIGIAVLSSIPRKKDAQKVLPHSITITDETISFTGEKLAFYRDINKIKSIEDFGTFYFFKMYFPNGNGTFICQKDLIIEGTIEEFEKLFEGKIVRKIK